MTAEATGAGATSGDAIRPEEVDAGNWRARVDVMVRPEALLAVALCTFWRKPASYTHMRMKGRFTRPARIISQTEPKHGSGVSEEPCPPTGRSRSETGQPTGYVRSIERERAR
jgi:hypothetical protein